MSFPLPMAIFADELSRKIFRSRRAFNESGDFKFMEAIIPFDKSLPKSVQKHCRGHQYFEPGIIEFAENEVFIDAGCAFGLVSQELLKRAGQKVEKIYAFEPDLQAQKWLAENLNPLLQDKMVLSKLGLWREKANLNWQVEEIGTGRVSENGAKKIAVEALDNLKIPERITFIKMDIEGAELAALEGAEKIIRRDRPKLAMSIYHQPEDLWTLPLLVKKMVPEYRLYLRHYSFDERETVLYAVI